MRTTNHCRARGVTLLELLVVLMILSIVLTAAVKTWDVTLERGRAETTARKLDQIVKVIVGDPDYIVAGQRADFGFVGDMGRLPDSLVELVVAPPASPRWRGPYIRSTFTQSRDAYQYDGWGDSIRYGYQRYRDLPDYKESLWVRSEGGRGPAVKSRWQTLRIPYSYDALTNNEVTGQIVDVRGDQAPPGRINNCLVRLYYPKLGVDTFEERTGPLAASFHFYGIPQGTHRIVAQYVNFATNPPTVYSATQQDVPVYPLHGVGAGGILMRLPVDWDVLP